MSSNTGAAASTLRQRAIDQGQTVSTPNALREALGTPSSAHREPLGELLLAQGKLKLEDLTAILADQKNQPSSRMGELSLASGKINEDDLYQALSKKFGLPYVRLGEFSIERMALAKIPQDVVRAYRALPLMLHEGRLVVAMRDPSDSEVIAALSVLTRMTIEPVLATSHDIDVAIAMYYPAFDDDALRAEAVRLGKRAKDNSVDVAATQELAQQQPIVRLVTNLLDDAVRRRASDIHIRPRERSAEVVYRIDGSLMRVREFSQSLLPAVAARIKVIAAMDLAEHRLPQDGAIHIEVAGRKVDLRVSIMPSLYGENIVIRILDRSAGLRRLSDVGFGPKDQKTFQTLIDRNQGLVLVTGPTGCGKTTTLYAALQELNSGEYNILTVEDPIEYRLDGIVQTQVHNAINFGFANALRHILRHDPDVILIGEIRDVETANIAMESALTGHLVLSTLHTNSAAQTITRLIEMGAPPYLVNATLAGVLAQRLVRRNCSECKIPETVDADLRAALNVEATEVFFKGRGCAECNGTGAVGRTAVYELLQMTPAMRALLRQRADDDQLQALAIQEGMKPLTQQALTLARSGEISLTEVFRARLE